MQLSDRYTSEPTVSVGILSADCIRAELHGTYLCSGAEVTGPVEVRDAGDGAMVYDGAESFSLSFVPAGDDCSFVLHDVVIGVGFHWERREDQRFVGELRFLYEGGRLTAVNVVPVEIYLASVISSEMSAQASPALLRAHAVISRSWLLAQLKAEHGSRSDVPSPDHPDSPSPTRAQSTAPLDSPREIIRWYDHDDHINYDVCADDHCQRYQGITRQTTPAVAEAVEATRGIVLTYGGELVDARFSKCCGGVMERFESCWEPVHHHYLDARRDSEAESDFPDLRDGQAARRWILGVPDAFCNTTDAAILSQVLNDYDRETADFYRWTVRYTAAELSALFARRTGIDVGRITALEPLERGTSGRIIRLRVCGTAGTVVVGKELEIRRALSASHLYSSAFVVEPGEPDAAGLPSTFTLRGAGWGHGAGLCQIGAAVMGARGYDFRQILRHYFIDAELKRLY